MKAPAKESSMSPPSAQRNTALDGLRGLAALSVVFYHALLHRKDLIDSVVLVPIQRLGSTEAVLQKLYLSIANGHTAVLLFFVLSGFVLARSLQRASGSFLTISLTFVLARAFRLYPALFLCMALYYALAWLYAWAGWVGFPVPDLKAALLNAGLLEIRWHGPSATLQAEMLAIPFLLATAFVGRHFGAAGLFCCLGYSVFAYENPHLIGNLPNMNAWLPAFLLGMLIADQRLAPFFEGVSNLGLGLLVAVFLGLKSFAALQAGSTTLAQILLCGALVGVVYHAAPHLSVICFLNSPPLQFLGRISYSLYLLNVLALLVVWSAVDRTALYQQHPLFTGLLVGLGATLVTLPVAAWSQRVVERGGIRLWLAIRQWPRSRALQSDGSNHSVA